eukprot:1149012-Pelagomonas_calceolata.AAC.4
MLCMCVSAPRSMRKGHPSWSSFCLAEWDITHSAYPPTLAAGRAGAGVVVAGRAFLLGAPFGRACMEELLYKWDMLHPANHTSMHYPWHLSSVTNVGSGTR